MVSQTYGLESPDSRNEENGDVEPRSPKRRKLTTVRNGHSPNSTTRRKTACQSCRMRKIKCDNVRPTCGICQASSTVCEYTDPLPEKLTLESATDLLCNKLSILQDGIDRLHSITQQNGCPVQDGLDRGKEDTLLHRQPTNSDRPQQSNAIYITEPSKDFLQIPPHRTTSDSVLTWEIFDGRYPPMSLVGVFFTFEEENVAPDFMPGAESFVVNGGMLPPNEEHIPVLVDRFLQIVHTKNPVLDVEQLVKQARIIASEGLGWNPWSCLVLLAAALGTIAKPFGAAVIASPGQTATSPSVIADTCVPATHKDLQQAESYFVAACRRLGCLKHSILGTQCYFFAGVYLMYTLRPLLSWQYFTHSSILYQLYMKTRYGLLARISDPNQLPTQHSVMMDAKQKRIEQSLYWSCFKSECEFRVELPLPQSEIASYQHPQMFPSPPSPASGKNQTHPSFLNGEETLSETTTMASMQDTNTNSPTTAEDMDLRRHAKELCNEEESWYYYLTEIALRRIGNRIINAFFRQDPTTWLEIQPLLGIALEFDTQVSAWSAHLPAAMQHWETKYAIRAPTLHSVSDGNGNHVSRELSWATENRLLEMRSWLYQPFLYYLIHSDAAPLHPQAGISASAPAGHVYGMHSRENSTGSAGHVSERLSSDDAAALYHFTTSGIECNLKILDFRSLRHRHHGLWYDLRSVMCASLILLAIVKSGHEAWIPVDVEVLWGMSFGGPVQDQPISGKIGHVLTEFDFWSIESPDLKRHREVLEDVARNVRGLWAARTAR